MTLGKYISSRPSTKGFTIVELLIVVVVIAILAAITIVAYNGIQNRAKTSAAQSAASQASKRIQQYYIENSDTYPADRSALDALGIIDGSTSFQYSVNNSANPKTFCVTASVQNVSYFINNTTNTSPTYGGCAGHAQNGREVITNLSLNPSVETTTTGWVTPFGSGTISGARDTERAYAGQYSFKVSRNGTSSDSRMVRYLVAAHPTGTYSFGAWVYVADSAIGNVSLSIEFCGSTGAIAGPPATNSGGVIGQWRRVTASYTISTAGNLCFNFIAGQNQVGSIFLDAVMIQAGTSLSPYADGQSQDWTWSGTPQSSTSFGPAP